MRMRLNHGLAQIDFVVKNGWRIGVRLRRLCYVDDNVRYRPPPKVTVLYRRADLLVAVIRPSSSSFLVVNQAPGRKFRSVTLDNTTKSYAVADPRGGDVARQMHPFLPKETHLYYH